MRQALTALFRESSESDTVLEMGRREKGEKIVGQIERENRFLGGVVEGGGWALLFAFHISRALTSARIRQRVCSQRSVLLFGGGDGGDAALHALSRSANAFR